MRIGPLRHKIDIQSKQSTTNYIGEPVTDWSTRISVRAQITPRSGDTSFEGDQDIRRFRFTIRMRYRSVSYDERIYHRASGRMFEIESIEPANKPTMMTIQVKQIEV